MAGRVDGKVTVVTGGASGIGRGCVERLAQEGAIVIVADVQDSMGEELVRQLAGTGAKVEYRHHDVSQEESWLAFYDHVRTAHGRLDVLVNNAGIGVGGPLIAMSLTDWHRQIAVNLDGVFLGIKYGIPFMAEGGGGSIINMCSSVGIIGQPMMAAYGATKGAARVLTKAVAMECGAMRNGVRVNAVHPGIIDTPIWVGQGSPDLDLMCQAAVPLGVKGLPVDIANGVLWFASDESRYVTGSDLVIDGGVTAGGTGPLMQLA